MAHAIVSPQQYDLEWEDRVDIDMAKIKHRNKIKVLIIDNRDPDNSQKSSIPITDGTSAAGRDSPAFVEPVKLGVGVEQLIKNLEDQQRALDYKFSISKATLEANYHSDSTCLPNSQNTGSKCGWPQTLTMPMWQTSLFTLGAREMKVVQTIGIMDYLLAQNTSACGTVWVNGKGLPPCVKKKLKQGDGSGSTRALTLH